ncbi:MAG: DUF3604 domain-containing protein [Pseudomonadota bacterium]
MHPIRRPSCPCAAGVLLAIAFTSVAHDPGLALDVPATPAQVGADCADHNPLRNVYFGDLHIHSELSHDAWVFGTLNGPGQVYAQSADTLDFAAVTDHARYLAEVSMCKDPGSLAYQHPGCVEYRQGILNPLNLNRICKASEPAVDPATCDRVSRKVWRRIKFQADAANDPCEFTTFTAYEYTLGSQFNGGSLHRNVYYVGDVTPRVAHDSWDYRSREALWSALEAECLDVAGCEVIAIAHNPNQSEGLEFDSTDLTADVAEQRRRFEPLVEVFQHKGSSECHPTLADDDSECAFEQPPVDRLLPPGTDEVPPGSFVRTALKDGLALESALGVNPFQVGFIASTDSHNGIGGTTEEALYSGNSGDRDDTPLRRLDGPSAYYNAGGLTGIWAEENTREALFASLTQRETFATSGTRLTVRSFAGESFEEELCGASDLLQQAYANGVPMGGELSELSGAAPAILLLAEADPASAPIQEVQIVKGWYSGGETHEQVIRLATYAPGQEVAADCQVWRDPQFDPLAPAFYYPRVFEAPTPRWSTLDCAAVNADCDRPEELPEPFAVCCDGSVPETIRERAWGSPIWYSP